MYLENWILIILVIILVVFYFRIKTLEKNARNNYCCLNYLYDILNRYEDKLLEGGIIKREDIDLTRAEIIHNLSLNKFTSKDINDFKLYLSSMNPDLVAYLSHLISESKDPNTKEIDKMKDILADELWSKKYKEIKKYKDHFDKPMSFKDMTKKMIEDRGLGQNDQW